MSFEYSEAVARVAVASGGIIEIPAPAVVSKRENCRARKLHPGYVLAKRGLDILFSSIIILLLAPVYLAIALAVKLTSRGSVFYCSKRIGQNGRPLKFLKFRTMYADADKRKRELLHLNEQNGPIFKIKNDPRITPVGAFLRKYSLDELPQFWHVLMGDMTLVGPRPHLPCEVEHYEKHHFSRLNVKPGLTCYWQVKGRSDLSFEEWMNLDLQYLEEMNFWLDLKLIAMTPAAVLLGKGAY